jgi:hypothetical protein
MVLKTLLVTVCLLISSNSSSQNMTDAGRPTLLRAKTIQVLTSTEWNKNHTFNPNVEGKRVFAAIDATPLFRHFRATDATHADLIIKIDDDEMLDRVTFDVLDPEDNSIIYTESRARVAIDNDIRRLVQHFLEAVETTRSRDAELREQARRVELQRKQLQTLAASLQRDWESVCAPDSKGCTPTPNQVWIDGNSLFELADYQPSGASDQHPMIPKRMVVNCKTEKAEDALEWSGTCVYNMTWSNGATCSVTTSERITSVSITRVDGVSQRIGWAPVKDGKCPIAAALFRDFSLVPKQISPEDQQALQECFASGACKGR